ncbi:MAG: hypothetical protein IE909_15195 [Campylobacterales bacterium]|nr:hypothetical protein [Campylobacterota bacterium]MBD3843193.1 hypothetical protein [Campylobacterales bacterium]
MLRKYIVLIFTIFSPLFSLEFDHNNSTDLNVDPYIGFKALNKNMYEPSKDLKLGIGLNIQSRNRSSFIFAYESEIYNYDRDGLDIKAQDLKNEYLKEGVITYKFNYKF